MSELQSAPQWEISKENIIPIKKGRSAKGLSESKLLVSLTESEYLDKERSLFEGKLEQATIKNNPMEKLEIYVKYIKWIRDKYPSNSEQALKILERCTFELKNEEELLNDSKFIKVWIDYADMVRMPGDIFSFMSSNKIGEKVALFWIAWAFVAETASNFKLTDQLFQKGIRRLAEPKDLLNKRYHQFQRRMARKYLNGTLLQPITTQSRSCYDVEEVAGTEQTASSMTVVDNVITEAAMTLIRTSGTTSSINNTTKQNIKNTENKRDENSRTALSGIVSYSNPSNTTSSSAIPFKPHTNARTNSSMSSNKNQAMNFVIFNENSDAVSINNSNNTNNTKSVGMMNSTATVVLKPEYKAQTKVALIAPTWHNLGTEESRRKENSGPITKWSSGPLTHSEPSIIFGSSSVETTIPIFVDEEFSKDTRDTSTFNDNKIVDLQIEDDRPVLNVRKRLEGISSESIAKNPLARHSQVVVAVPKLHVTSEPIDLKAQQALGNSTIGFEIFNDCAPNNNATENVTMHNNLNSNETGNSTSDDKNLEEMFSNIMQMDVEDGTINTRLARRDIDLMFCSPTVKIKSLSSIQPPMESSFTIYDDAKDMIPPPSSSCIDTNTHLHCGQDKILSQQQHNLFLNASHKPFGTELDTYSALKDLSAIKESSQEFSLNGMLETPLTLGMDAAKHRNARSSYSIGNILMDTSYATGDYNSRDSLSSGTQSLQVNEPFKQNPTGVDTVVHKRKGLSSSIPTQYKGIGMGNIPSRRKLYNTIHSDYNLVELKDNINQEYIIHVNSSNIILLSDKQYESKQLSVDNKVQQDVSETILPGILVNIISDCNNIQACEQTKGFVYDATLLNTLEPEHFESIVKYVISYYQQKKVSTDIVVDVVDCRKYNIPSCFTYRNRYSELHSCYYNNLKQWKIVKNIGRGAFGYAILMKLNMLSSKIDVKGNDNNNNNDDDGWNTHNSTKLELLKVYKVDRKKDSVLWEMFIHMQIQMRILLAVTSSVSMETYYKHFLPPDGLYLYSDASIMTMNYAENGTLIQVIEVLMKNMISMTTVEHEYITAYLSIQIVEAMLFLHSVGIIHGDIKTDNWVVRVYPNQSFPSIRLYLIDFGKARSVWKVNKNNHQPTRTRLLEEKEQLFSLYHWLNNNCVIEDDDQNNPSSLFPNNTISNINNSNIEIIQYEGDISAKGYQCFEVKQQNTWNYQIDSYGVCSCIHQLLYFQIMQCQQENNDRLKSRGFEINDIRTLLGNTNTSFKNEVYQIPSISLKRYWNKRCWSIVYLLLLNTTTQLECQQSPYIIQTRVVIDALYLHLQQQIYLSFSSSLATTKTQNDILTRVIRALS